MSSYNQSTKITTSILGVLLGIAGFVNHGVFEVLQGNTATNGFFIEAIGPANRFWEYGTEGAFTVIPNFLVTGICVMLDSLAIILGSIKYMQSKYGASVLLLLLIVLTVVGGGIGHIVLSLPVWAYATRINKSLAWWRKILHGSFRKALSGLWVLGLVATSVFLFSSVMCVNVTFISAFARDIQDLVSESNE